MKHANQGLQKQGVERDDIRVKENLFVFLCLYDVYSML